MSFRNRTLKWVYWNGPGDEWMSMEALGGLSITRIVLTLGNFWRVCSTIHRCSQDTLTLDSIWVVQTDKYILYFLFMCRTNYRLLLLGYSIITPQLCYNVCNLQLVTDTQKCKSVQPYWARGWPRQGHTKGSLSDMAGIMEGVYGHGHDKMLGFAVS